MLTPVTWCRSDCCAISARLQSRWWFHCLSALRASNRCLQEMGTLSCLSVETLKKGPSLSLVFL